MQFLHRRESTAETQTQYGFEGNCDSKFRVSLHNPLLGEVNQAKAQKAAQRSQVVSAQSEANNARIRVEQARLELQQARANITRLEASFNASIERARLEAEQTATDAARLSLLAREGAITEQQAEQA